MFWCWMLLIVEVVFVVVCVIFVWDYYILFLFEIVVGVVF